jgi:NAD+ kinase
LQPARMANIMLSIDGKPLSQWACDGVLCATPTGSTAYAFSAGGPVIWPEVDALLVVPISAHALFARPLVTAPGSTVDIDVLSGPVVVDCDGRRSFELSAGGRVRVTRDPQSVRFARVHEATFTERLVAKFQLPVTGWRRA